MTDSDDFNDSRLESKLLAARCNLVKHCMDLNKSGKNSSEFLHKELHAADKNLKTELAKYQNIAQKVNSIAFPSRGKSVLTRTLRLILGERKFAMAQDEEVNNLRIEHWLQCISVENAMVRFLAVSKTILVNTPHDSDATYVAVMELNKMRNKELDECRAQRAENVCFLDRLQRGGGTFE